MIDLCEHKKIRLIISGINTQPQSVLDKAGLTEKIGKNEFFEYIEDAIKASEK
jgi:SulP family sulfate permease